MFMEFNTSLFTTEVMRSKQTRRKEGLPELTYSTMLSLFFMAFISSTYGSGETFLNSSASEASLYKSVAAHKLSNLALECAHHCHLEQSKCEGFQLDTTSPGVCKLYEKICFIDTGSDMYFGRKDVIANLETRTDLALGKPASQSSTHAGALASNANDGMYPTSDAGMSHTTNEYGPWWRVDMESTTCVTAVYFMNRGHAQHAVIWQRTRNVAVTVSMLEEDIMDTGDNRCGYIDGLAQQFGNLVTCNEPMVGRYVQLQVLDTSILNIYEVEVHGH